MTLIRMFRPMAVVTRLGCMRVKSTTEMTELRVKKALEEHRCGDVVEVGESGR